MNWQGIRDTFNRITHIPARIWRRAIRTLIYTVTILASLAFLGWIIELAAKDAITLRLVATGLLGIVTISVLGYTAENVTQRIKFHGGADGFDAEIGDDDKGVKS